MITLNINIGTDGKSISSSSISTTHSQGELPSPISQHSIDAAGDAVPTPKQSSLATDSDSNSSVPHPEAYLPALSATSAHAPNPIEGNVQLANAESEVPTPLDMENLGSASPSTKPKTRSTKRKSGTK